MGCCWRRAICGVVVYTVGRIVVFPPLCMRSRGEEGRGASSESLLGEDERSVGVFNDPSFYGEVDASLLPVGYAKRCV